MSKITTHILDLAKGAPAFAVNVKVFRVKGEKRCFLTEDHTNQDGRVTEPLVEAAEPGIYELVFAIGEYFTTQEKGTFFTDVPVRFEVCTGEEHYHVPLLVSPWGYQIYRGS